MKKLVKNRIQGLILAGIFIILPFQNVLASEITASRVIQLVNEERRKNGVTFLVENEILNMAAQKKLADMFANNYFSHISPTGITPWHWFDQVKYDYERAGENLAINFESAEVQNEAWMKSPTHRKNILNASFQEIGVAVARGVIDGQEGIVTVQFFGSQKFPNGNVYHKVFSGATKGASAEAKVSAISSASGTEKLEPFGNEKYKPYSFFAAFFSYVGNEFFSGEKVNERIIRIFLAIVALALIALNAVVLSRKNQHNPFAAVNSVVFAIMFTVLLFW